MSSTATVVRSEPLTRFTNAARAYERSLIRAFLISPWIVARSPGEFPAFGRLISTLQASKARVTVLTRTPDNAGHHAAVELLSRLSQVEIFFLDSLHAKIYLLECNTFRLAMVGSPNFTLQGDSEWRELAVEVRSGRQADVAAQLVRDLFGYAVDLISDDAARVHKRLTLQRPRP